MHLIVKVPFHDHEIGQRISDKDMVASILGGDKAHLEKHCIRIRDDAHGFRPEEQLPPNVPAARPARAVKADADPGIVMESPFAVHAPSKPLA